MIEKMLFYFNGMLSFSFDRRLFYYLKRIERNRIQLEKFKKQKLKKLLIWAYRTVPFYRRYMSKMNLNPYYNEPYHVLSKLPIVNKEIIRSKPLDFISCKFSPKIPVQTSGSTGKPSTFLHDISVRRAGSTCFYYGLSWYGYNLGDRILRLWGRRPVSSLRSILTKNLLNYLLNIRDIDAHRMSKKNMMRYYLFIKKEKPRVLYGYVSSINLLGNFIKARNLDPPKSILSSQQRRS